MIQDDDVALRLDFAGQIIDGARAGRDEEVLVAGNDAVGEEGGVAHGVEEEELELAPKMSGGPGCA